MSWHAEMTELELHRDYERDFAEISGWARINNVVASTEVECVCSSDDEYDDDEELEDDDDDEEYWDEEEEYDEDDEEWDEEAFLAQYS